MLTGKRSNWRTPWGKPHRTYQSTSTVRQQ